jgi:hypothetical protein
MLFFEINSPKGEPTGYQFLSVEHFKKLLRLMTKRQRIAYSHVSISYIKQKHIKVNRQTFCTRFEPRTKRIWVENDFK